MLQGNITFRKHGGNIRMKKYIFATTLAAAVVLAPATVRADFSFTDVKDVVFYFQSGAGAWDTHLMIEADGSFAGNYHDSEMGVVGEGYPNGTMYFCDFTGKFTEPEKVDDYTYVFRLADLNLAKTPEEQEIIDQTLYQYCEAYGLEDAEDFYLYLPGKPLDGLPEEFLSWVGYYDLSQTDDTALKFYGLYNENAQQGFSGYKAEKSYISQLVERAETEGEPLAAELDGGNLPQQQLNMKSYDLYQVWDKVLNEIWAYLKAHLDPQEMSELREEELIWIADKEADIKRQGSEFEGGTMQPYVENVTAYNWTKDRVYELEKRYGDY